MKEPEIINYIPEKETPKFRLFFARPVAFGAWFFTRCLYSIDVEGKAWQQNIFVVFVGLFTVVTVAADAVALLVAWIFRAAFYILRELWRLVVYAVKVVFERFLGTALRWIAFVLVALILWLKWDEITAIIRLWRW